MRTKKNKKIKEETKRDTFFGDKRFYFGTLRAQWSNAEFELIFINSLYERNSKFKNLIK
ncbi:putative phage abortive infection protein [Bacillus cereus]|uniref:putative phage abortive infection protein n=1 Tax=Bacillus cereus TaxID=1396 RepID=UPI001F0A2611|nr:putative phage abortive infection protein [Bacillus cereus]